MDSPTDIYHTIEQPSQGLYKEKGSKFIAFAYPVYSEDEIKIRLDALKKEYFDARHHCYAWRLGADLLRFRSNDDGEPSGTAGKPILGQIQSTGLTNILIIVIRYFGGIKLGTSGLIHAYKTAAQDALQTATQVQRFVTDTIQVEFDYACLNDVMKVLKDAQLNPEKPVFDLNCHLYLTERQSLIPGILLKLKEAGASCQVLSV